VLDLGPRTFTKAAVTAKYDRSTGRVTGHSLPNGLGDRHDEFPQRTQFPVGTPLKVTAAE
jgi:hypothetical protein